MRNALICAGVMLAMLLMWPLIFAVGGGSEAKASQTVHGGSTTRMTIPPAGSWRPPLARNIAMPGGSSASTCFRRYRAAYDTCPPARAEVCHRNAIDGWDVCEATGFWSD